MVCKHWNQFDKQDTHIDHLQLMTHISKQTKIYLTPNIFIPKHAETIQKMLKIQHPKTFLST